ncbi:pyruvate kinase [Candidatus Parcubacteria bacterium]|nr:pyruvate kinase [Candidatus Parcubacteria bacterium]
MKKFSKTKIITTIGPRTANEKDIKRLVDSGISMFRLNASHNTLKWHQKVIELIRKNAFNIPILLDIPGKKVRVSQIKVPKKLKIGEPFIFTASPNIDEENRISVDYDFLHKDVKPNDIILADDGTLKFYVLKIVDNNIHTRIEAEGILCSRKGINVPYRKLNNSLINYNDKVLLNFSRENKVDYIGVSFAESGEYIQKIRKYLKSLDIGIIAKIENIFGLNNLENIIRESDGIMIDRGDLGAETKIEHLSILQKRIIKKTNQFGKPVIVATEMMDSMIEKSTPTKAEVSDISNAILDGTSCIMLSGETAIGRFPEKCVEIMQNIAKEVEGSVYLDYPRIKVKKNELHNIFGKAISDITNIYPVDYIICITKTGFAVSVVSKFKPRIPIIVVTDNITTYRKLNIIWGVFPFLYPKEFSLKSDEYMYHVIRLLIKNRIIDRKDKILITYVKNPVFSEKMNTIEVHTANKFL